MAKTKRISEIDSLKGLLIILVILGHTKEIHEHFRILYSWIYTFHMPIFFILAGIFYKPGLGIKEYYKKIAYNYLRPYFITAFICIIAGSIYNHFTHHHFIESLTSLLFNSLYVTSYRWTLGPIWFLWSLFWALTTFHLISSKIHSSPTKLFITLSLFTLSVASLVIYMPLSLQSGLSAVVYVYIGAWAKNYKDEIKNICSYLPFVCVIIFLWVYTTLRMEVHISDTLYPHGLTSVFCTSVISLFIISHAKLLECKFLTYIGKHTLLILCIHQILIHVGGYNPPLNIMTANSFSLLIIECTYNTIITLALAFIFERIRSKWPLIHLENHK